MALPRMEPSYSHLTSLIHPQMGAKEKPRSDGSGVYFGYEREALVVSGPGICSATSGETTGLFNQLLFDVCQYPRMGVSGFSYE